MFQNELKVIQPNVLSYITPSVRDFINKGQEIDQKPFEIKKNLQLFTTHYYATVDLFQNFFILF